MPGDPLQIASSAGVIAYNGENPRGWNDPPTFAFSNKGERGRGKPKLDLRKRVSHQQALTGTPGGMAVPTTSQPPTYTTKNDVTRGLAGLNISSTQPNQVPFAPPTIMAATHQPFVVPPVNMATQPPVPVTMTTQPPVPVTMTTQPTFPVTNGVTQSSGYILTPTPPIVNQNATFHTPQLGLPPITKSISVPSELMHAGEPHVVEKLTPPLSGNSSTENVSTNLGQPLCSLRTHAYEPVVTAHPLAIRSGADINDLHLDDNGQSERIPQIYNPLSPPTTGNTPPLENVPLTFHHRSLSLPGPKHEHINPPIGHITPPPTLNSSNSGSTTPPVAPVNSTLPFTAGQPTINQSLPPSNQDPTKGGQSATPPPLAASTISTPPISLSAGNTPRILSPVPNHPKLNDEFLQDFDDEEGLKKTMDAFQDVINKHQDKLQKRVVDDVKKRLQVMSQSWKNGKLSKFVKARMIHLAEALDSGNSDEAHRMHVSIMVDHVSEVNQWMVGVKKLISVVGSNSNSNIPHS